MPMDTIENYLCGHKAKSPGTHWMLPCMLTAEYYIPGAVIKPKGCWGCGVILCDCSKY